MILNQTFQFHIIFIIAFSMLVHFIHSFPLQLTKSIVLNT